MVVGADGVGSLAPTADTSGFTKSTPTWSPDGEQISTWLMTVEPISGWSVSPVRRPQVVRLREPGANTSMIRRGRPMAEPSPRGSRPIPATAISARSSVLMSRPVCRDFGHFGPGACCAVPGGRPTARRSRSSWHTDPGPRSSMSRSRSCCRSSTSPLISRRSDRSPPPPSSCRGVTGIPPATSSSTPALPTADAETPELFTIRPDGSEVRQLTNLAVEGSSAIEPTSTSTERAWSSSTTAPARCGERIWPLEP